MKKILVLLVILLFTSVTMPASDVPYLMGRVNDYATILNDDAKKELESILRAHESETSNQLVILTLLSLDGEVLEDFAYKVFSTWQLGQKDKNNGVLILVSVNDQVIRIEVGYGLEGSLTDAQCSSIIRNEMAPNFRRNDFSAGMLAAVKAIISAIDGTYSPEETEYSGDDFETVPFPMNIFVGIFVMSILLIFTVTGVFSKGCSSWFLFFFLIPFYATFPLFVFGPVIAGIIMLVYIFGYIAIKILLGTKSGMNYLETKAPKINKAFSSMQSWSSKSGSSGGGWSSGGGFSGGGGSSGGGGASGGW